VRRVRADLDAAKVAAVAKLVDAALAGLSGTCVLGGGQRPDRTRDVLRDVRGVRGGAKRLSAHIIATTSAILHGFVIQAVIWIDLDTSFPMQVEWFKSMQRTTLGAGNQEGGSQQQAAAGSRQPAGNQLVQPRGGHVAPAGRVQPVWRGHARDGDAAAPPNRRGQGARAAADRGLESHSAAASLAAGGPDAAAAVLEIIRLRQSRRDTDASLWAADKHPFGR
jgi:hypothetical protein